VVAISYFSGVVTDMENGKTPARLHVILAKNSSQAIIIRRGPSKRVATIGWDRRNDSFTIGQWLKGKIYPYRSDISPDGVFWLYFAMSDKNQMWTAVAKPPYLKALDFYSKNCAWNGGGLFASARSYWLNDGGCTLHKRERSNSGLAVLPQWGDEPNWQGECPGVYFLRLVRDGWNQQEGEQIGRHNYITKFYKRINGLWQLQKLFYSGLNQPIGKSPYYESHALYNAKHGITVEMLNAEWADVDKNRIVWAEEGKIMSGRMSKSGLAGQTMLFDTNPLVFTELTAPY